MNPHRKRIITSEIMYWKKNKLLPEHYCDFLLTLYTEGEAEEAVSSSDSVLSKEKKRISLYYALIAFGAIAAAASLFIFNEYPAITISAAAGAAGIFLLLSLNKRLISSGMMPLLYILSAFLLLALTFKIWSAFFGTQVFLLVGMLIMNCLIWLLAGRLLNLLYFTISGAVGLIMIIVFLFI